MNDPWGIRGRIEPAGASRPCAHRDKKLRWKGQMPRSIMKALLSKEQVVKVRSLLEVARATSGLELTVN
jgi:hypothetical protein